MPQFAVCYAPSASVQPSNTTKTGSFYIGTMAVRNWDMFVNQTGISNTRFFASPLTSSGYIMAIPNPNTSSFGGVTQPQFFQSTTVADATFILMCSYILKTYKANGQVGTPPVNAAGCSSTSDCMTQFTTAGWYQNYQFITPA